MTPAEKAKLTRQKHKESRDRKALDKQRIAEAIIQGCLEILADESSSVGQRLEALRILNVNDEVR